MSSWAAVSRYETCRACPNVVHESSRILDSKEYLLERFATLLIAYADS